MRTLEEFTLEQMWQLYLRANPPPADIDPAYIRDAKGFFTMGVATAAAFMDRLLTEPPERARALVGQLLKDSMTACGEMPQS